MSFSDPKHSIEQFRLGVGMDVADFGAGAGYLAVETAEAVGPDGTVFVIDIQQELLTKVTHYAKEHHLECFVYIHGDLETERGSTLPDNSVDAVIVSNILFQVDKKDVLLTEAVRILRPNGRILLIDWKESYGNMGPHKDAVLSESDARHLLKQVGLTYVSSIDAGTYHYGLIFRKHGTS